MAHQYYIRACLGAPDSTTRLVYRYFLRKGDTAVGYTISRCKDQVAFFDTKPKAIAAMLRIKTKGQWEVAIYKPRSTPGLRRISEPYTTSVRQITGTRTMVVEILRREGKLVLAKILEQELTAILIRRKAAYLKAKAQLLKENSNGRPN